MRNLLSQSKSSYPVLCTGNKMADAFNEKLAEAVRRFPALYDKSCPDFKDKNKRKLAWFENSP